MSQRGTERAARLIPWALWVLFSVCALAQGSTDGHRRDEATLQLSVSCTKTSFTENEPGWGIHLTQVTPTSCVWGSERLGVPVGDDRAIRRRLHSDRLLNQPVEQLAPAT